MGYRLFIPELRETVVGVHVTFNEVIPTYTEEYFNELNKLKFEVAHDESTVASFQHLVDYISVDIAVFVNCESRQGYKYVVCFVDHATKFLWVYGMKTRDEYIEKLRHLVDVELHSHGVKLKHYHTAEARRISIYLEPRRHTKIECYI